ncbi:MAG: ATP-binding protein, partial [Pseudomonadota bacterium]
LSSCRRIIRAHYGRIWVTSSPNEGSRFHFILPIFRA